MYTGEINDDDDTETISENIDDEITEIKSIKRKKGYVKFESLSLKGKDYQASLPKFDMKKLAQDVRAKYP